MYVSIPWACGIHESQKRASDLLELERGVGSSVGAGN